MVMKSLSTSKTLSMRKAVSECRAATFAKQARSRAGERVSAAAAHPPPPPPPDAVTSPGRRALIPHRLEARTQQAVAALHRYFSISTDYQTHLPISRHNKTTRKIKRKHSIVSTAEDVIELGLPRGVCSGSACNLRQTRRRRVYVPNPRLYPGPKPLLKKKPSRSRPRRRKRFFRLVVPNSRLYRPAPARPRSPPPPPAYPKCPWRLTPTPRLLDTASREALRLSTINKSKGPAWRSFRSGFGLEPNKSATAAGGDQAARVRRLRGVGPRPPPLPAATSSPPPPPRRAACSRLRIMDARHSTSLEDASEVNETAPSEFLAEFLSAIMRRQYAEALKYCRLILQYEPHNHTARGFYPLLQHKLRKQTEEDSLSSSEEASPHNQNVVIPHTAQERMQQEADDWASGAGSDEGSERGSDEGSDKGSRSPSASSLDLDSSASLTSRTEHTNSNPLSAGSVAGGGSAGVSAAGSGGSAAGSGGSAGGWDSAGTSRSDDNGNPQHPTHNADDVKNDNANSMGDHRTDSKIKAESPSLQRLRAQFSCSIK